MIHTGTTIIVLLPRQLFEKALNPPEQFSAIAKHGASVMKDATAPWFPVQDCALLLLVLMTQYASRLCSYFQT